MENKELMKKDIPSGYELCFNSECEKKDCCMHYQARLLVADERFKGAAIYPVAWKNGECGEFRKKRLVRKAWGFSRLYHNVPNYLKAEARRNVSATFGHGNGPYYRAHHGEIMLSPKHQEEIMHILSKFGSTEGIGFDHYVTTWDFD